jgi:hypothetical protein
MELKSMSNPRVGDRVRIERDETQYPSKGTWPQYRGRVGTVVEVNAGEYGVSFGKVTPRKSRPSTSDWKSNDVAWFQAYEVRLLAQKGVARPPEAPRIKISSLPPSNFHHWSPKQAQVFADGALSQVIDDQVMT